MLIPRILILRYFSVMVVNNINLISFTVDVWGKCFQITKIQEQGDKWEEWKEWVAHFQLAEAVEEAIATDTATGVVPPVPENHAWDDVIHLNYTQIPTTI